MKNPVKIIHRWLGFIAGLVLFLSLLPASIFVFEKELTDWYYHDMVFAAKKTVRPVPMSQIREIASRTFGKDKPLNEILVYNDTGRAYVCMAYRESKRPGLTFFSQYDYWEQLYIDPYTGKIKGKVNMIHNWINLLRYIHQQMLLSYNIGHWLIAVASLIIFVSIITGLVLWFPRNKAMLRQRFKIKWDARWRRKNYDIHNVGGFYTHSFILILAMTGLVWSFNWWTNGIYRLLGDDPEKVFQHKTSVSEPLEKLTRDPLDVAYANALMKRTNWTVLDMAMPGFGEEEGEDKNTYAFYLNYNDHGGWDEADEYYYHKATGGLKKQSRHENKTIGEKWRNSNYAIHTGSIYGLPSKILVSAATLFCAFLPITGILIWYGRRKRTPRINIQL